MKNIATLALASAFAASMLSGGMALAQSQSNESGTSVTNGQSKMNDPMSSGDSGTAGVMDPDTTGSIKRDCSAIADQQERLNCDNQSGVSNDMGNTSGAGQDGTR